MADLEDEGDHVQRVLKGWLGGRHFWARRSRNPTCRYRRSQK